MRTKLAISLLVIGVAAWSQTAGEPAWTKYSHDGGKFSVTLPGQPEENSKSQNGVQLHTFQLVQRPRMYMVIYSDYPEGDLKLETSRRLRLEQEGFLKGI